MNLNENTLAEQPVLDWLKEMGYEYAYGPDISPGGAFQERGDYRDVILETRLKRSLKRINPHIPEQKLDEVVQDLIKYTNQDLVLGNKEIYKWITAGVTVDWETGDDRIGDYVQIIDFKNPDNNEFLVVNQFSVQGNSVRIPDVVVFINGIPVAVFELKNPTDEKVTIADAYSQIQDLYKKEIPKLFFYNQVLVISDLMKAKHGTISSTFDFFSVWRGIDSEDEKHTDKSDLELLVKGLFNTKHLVDIIENFIIFEADAEKDASKFTKKMAMYHQYFGVNKAIEKTLKAVSGNKKVGVFWHTQGSGKSLSMVFYVNKAKKLPELKSPTFLFLTDRNDLDQQLYKTFLRTNYPTAKQSDSRDGLANLLKEDRAGVLFTTIQKFEARELLSNRDNIIVIADEAHRSQYAKFAGNVRDVLPNASFMGITGTPISLSNRNTQMVFGSSFSEYRIDQSVDDETTVPIYYEGRLTPLHILNEDIDLDFDQLVAEHPSNMKDTLRRKWANLESAVGAEDRLKKVANDVVYHFINRRFEGKAMLVTMSRNIAVKMYEIITRIKDAPEVAVIISSNKDYQGKIQQALDNKELEKRFKNPDDPLQIVIVCDMWLTGFDVPHLNTLYLDKPLKGHTLMQAIARVNRRYKDKEGGLIVDYIGVADNLKKALAIYTSDVQKEAMIPIEIMVTEMLKHYEEVKSFFKDIDYKEWPKLPNNELATLFAKAVNMIITDPITGGVNAPQKDQYLKVASRLYKLFALVMPHREANDIREEVEFYEGVRKMIIKNTEVDPIYIEKDTETAIQDLISKGIVAENIIDVFGNSNKGKPDISILDDKFLEDIKNSHFKNLTIEAIKKLLDDELRNRRRTNISRYDTLLNKLQEIIEEYENNIINSSKVIEKLVELAKKIKEAGEAGKEVGLNSEEMAFYDALSQDTKLKDGNLKKIVKDIIHAIKADIAIDWTNHEVIKARVRADVRMVLLRNNISYEEVNSLVERVYNQASSLYKDFPTIYTQELFDSVLDKSMNGKMD